MSVCQLWCWESGYFAWCLVNAWREVRVVHVRGVVDFFTFHHFVLRKNVYHDNSCCFPISPHNTVERALTTTKPELLECDWTLRHVLWGWQINNAAAECRTLGQKSLLEGPSSFFCVCHSPGMVATYEPDMTCSLTSRNSRQLSAENILAFSSFGSDCWSECW